MFVVFFRGYPCFVVKEIQKDAPLPSLFCFVGDPSKKDSLCCFFQVIPRKRESLHLRFLSRARSPGRLPPFPPPLPGWRMSRGGPGFVAALLHGMQTSPAEGRAATRAAASRRSGGRRTLLFLGPRCCFFVFFLKGTSLVVCPGLYIVTFWV